MDVYYDIVAQRKKRRLGSMKGQEFIADGQYQIQRNSKQIEDKEEKTYGRDVGF